MISLPHRNYSPMTCRKVNLSKTPKMTERRGEHRTVKEVDDILSLVTFADENNAITGLPRRFRSNTNCPIGVGWRFLFLSNLDRINDNIGNIKGSLNSLNAKVIRAFPLAPSGYSRPSPRSSQRTKHTTHPTVNAPTFHQVPSTLSTVPAVLSFHSTDVTLDPSQPSTSKATLTNSHNDIDSESEHVKRT